MNKVFLLAAIGFAALFVASCSEKTTEPLGKAAKPAFNIHDGIYTEPQTLIMTCQTVEADIRYTTDGSEPRESSLLYSEPLIITTDTVVKARAYKAKWTPSEKNVLNIMIDEDLDVQRIEFFDLPDTVQVNTTLTITAGAFTADDNPVPDGTVIAFSSTNGFFEGEYSSGVTQNGRTEISWNTGTIAGTALITAGIAEITSEAEIFIAPGEPASIILSALYRADEDNLLPIPPEGIPYNVGIHIKALVQDEFDNPVLAGTPVRFQSNLGFMQIYAETDKDGIAHPQFYPTDDTGTFRINAIAGEATAMIEFLLLPVDIEVHSIVFASTEDLELVVQGVGGVQARTLLVGLFDSFGLHVSGIHWLQIDVIETDIPGGIHFGDGEQSSKVLANNGIATFSVKSGTTAGTFHLKASLSDNPDVYSLKRVIVHSGPPHDIELFAGGYNTGSSMGNGVWRIGVTLTATDIHGNPVEGIYVVLFSIGSDPLPPENSKIEPSFAVMDSGTAETFLYYHGANTNEQLTIAAEIQSVQIAELITLPIQYPSVSIQASPSYFSYPDEFLLAEIYVGLVDSQGNDISGSEFLITAPWGQFKYYEWFDSQGNPINDPYQHPDPYHIMSYQGLAKGNILIHQNEVPPEEMHAPVRLTVYLTGTDEEYTYP